jgi:hypothetical protein
MSIPHVRRLALHEVLIRFIRVGEASVLLGQEFRSNEHIEKKAQSRRA